MGVRHVVLAAFFIASVLQYGACVENEEVDDVQQAKARTCDAVPRNQNESFAEALANFSPRLHAPALPLPALRESAARICCSLCSIIHERRCAAAQGSLSLAETTAGQFAAHCLDSASPRNTKYEATPLVTAQARIQQFFGKGAAEGDGSGGGGHTSNWAVIVCASRYWRVLPQRPPASARARAASQRSSCVLELFSP